MLIPKCIKNAWKMYVTGFHPDELYNLDITIAEFILPRLREYRKHLTGCPADIYAAHAENEEAAMAAWWDELGKMVFAFEVVSTCQSDESAEMRERVDEGLQLFAKRLTHLWQ